MRKIYKTVKTEKALLVVVKTQKENWPQNLLIEEFKNLVASCGIEVVDLAIVKKEKPTPSLY
ncbi:MAG TPA: hypothetical protein EYP89_03800, partial [Candidatus Omnitrophica bacterium]|nr:hypothetical protein [Candidatus Omnitrophota bacterium]